MSFTLTDHRRRRSTAKGNVTKISQQAKTLQSIEPRRLEAEVLRKQLEMLDKADIAFQAQHQAICETDNDTDEEQLAAELVDHEATVAIVQSILRRLEDLLKATQILLELEDALESLERDAEEGYTPDLDTAMEEVRGMVQDFRKARTRGAANDCPELRRARDDVGDRLRVLQRMKGATEPPKVEVATTLKSSEITEIKPRPVKSLKMKLPTFDREILNWREFWRLFSSLIKQEPHLSDEEKRAHLTGAMGTPECKTKAEAAFSYTHNYDDAIVRLRMEYERNRVLQAHYVANAIEPERFRNKKPDLERLVDRMERNLTGMEIANGYTATQVFATIFESFMEPCLITEWRKHTQDQTDPPSTDDMLVFLRKQIRSAPDVPLGQHDRETPHKHRQQSHKPSRKTVLRTQVTSDKCLYCHDNHNIFLCSQLKQKSVRQRRDWVKQNHLCFNCLSSKHISHDCPSQKRCKECSADHHTLFHDSGYRQKAENNESTVTVNLVSG